MVGDLAIFHPGNSPGIIVLGKDSDRGEICTRQLGQDKTGWMGKTTTTELHLMVRSRFGEFYSCCCLHALPGPAWVLLKYVLHTILCTSVLAYGPKEILLQMRKK